MRTMVGVLVGCGFLLGCASPPYRFVGSAPCLPGDGTVETWCTDDGACEFRVSSGLTTSCPAGNQPACVEAGRAAAQACIDGGLDGGGLDGGPTDVGSGRPDAGPCTPSTELDLLLAIDNSNSMDAEQALLRSEIPGMLAALAPLASLHVGIITSDMGSGMGGVVIPSCRAGFGDDGILRDTARAGGSCASTYPSRVFSFERGGDPASFSADVGCVADIGTGGCGFEQQLEATLKALSPAGPQSYVSSTYVPPTFVGGTRGHADGTNEGFLRTDSVLAIVVLTDEEDCSAPDYEIFNPDSTVYRGTNLALRCHRFPDAQYPVGRYIDGLLQLRSRPSRLVYSSIVGVPPDLVGRSYEDMLADARMIETEDPSVDPPMNLLASCESPYGRAFPPRRIVEVARGLRDRGAATTVHSICAAAYTSGANAIVEAIRSALACTGP